MADGQRKQAKKVEQMRECRTIEQRDKKGNKVKIEQCVEIQGPKVISADVDKVSKKTQGKAREEVAPEKPRSKGDKKHQSKDASSIFQRR